METTWFYILFGSFQNIGEEEVETEIIFSVDFTRTHLCRISVVNRSVVVKFLRSVSLVVTLD